jgi:hypothetical protein
MGLLTSPRTRTGRSRAQRRRPGTLGRALPLLLPALLLATLLPLGGSGAAALGPPTVTAGRLAVEFPSTSPGVEIYSELNASNSAELLVTHVLELAPSNTDHPTVVRVATPTVSAAYEENATSATQTTFGLQLAGAVPVEPANLPLWQNRDWLPPTLGSGNTVGGASLTVSYAYLPGTGVAQGVGLSWTIRDWPWHASGDLLGVVLDLVTSNATGFAGCQAADSVANASSAACPWSSLAPGSIVWNSTHLGGIFATAPGGPTASFTWSATENLSGAGPSPITAGAFYDGPGSAQITIVAPAAGSENVTAGGHLLLATTPVLPSILPSPAVLRADPFLVGAAVAVFAGAGLGGVLLYRRHDRRVRESL